jgi:hypothetical protein
MAAPEGAAGARWGSWSDLDAGGDAKEKAERVTTEFETLSLSDWCARYEVPEDFFADKI